MNLSDLGKTIAKFGAPLLGAVIGGPAGTAVGALVANAFGGDIDEPQKLIQSIVGDPQATVKLAEIESTKSVELQRLIIVGETNRLENESKQLALANANTVDARGMFERTKSSFPQILSTIVTLGFFGTLYWVASYPQDPTDQHVLYLLLGSTGSAFATVVNFWLGSSADKSPQTIGKSK